MNLEFPKQTDKIHEITLDSEITHALWCQKIAPVGGKAVLEVRTHFVGNGSEIKIKVEDKKGKTIEKIKGQVYADLFRTAIIVPEKAKEELTFVAKLPKHSLEMESGKLKVIPAINVTNLKWGQNEARRGDIVKLSADIEGVPDDTEVKIVIYEYDQDEAHDFITKFPCIVKNKKIETEWEYEYHEETDEVPTEEELQEYGKHYNPPEYFFVVDVYGQRFGKNQESKLLLFKDWIEYKIITYTGNERYKLKFPDGTEREGAFDDEGVLREEDMPPGPYTIEIITEE